MDCYARVNPTGHKQLQIWVENQTRQTRRGEEEATEGWISWEDFIDREKFFTSKLLCAWLLRHPLNTAAVHSTCAECGDHFEESLMRVSGLLYHEECLQCHHCKAPLEDTGFMHGEEVCNLQP